MAETRRKSMREIKAIFRVNFHGVKTPAPAGSFLAPEILGGVKKPNFSQFRRASAGGFGVMIPEPSSGSGG